MFRRQSNTAAPNTISGSMPHSLYSSNITFKWQPKADDTNGIGLFRYEVYRDGSITGYVYPGFLANTQYEDETCFMRRIAA